MNFTQRTRGCTGYRGRPVGGAAVGHGRLSGRCPCGGWNELGIGDRGPLPRRARPRRPARRSRSTVLSASRQPRNGRAAATGAASAGAAWAGPAWRLAAGFIGASLFGMPFGGGLSSGRRPVVDPRPAAADRLIVLVVRLNVVVDQERVGACLAPVPPAVVRPVRNRAPVGAGFWLGSAARRWIHPPTMKPSSLLSEIQAAGPTRTSPSCAPSPRRKWSYLNEDLGRASFAWSTGPRHQAAAGRSREAWREGNDDFATVAMQPRWWTRRSIVLRAAWSAAASSRSRSRVWTFRVPWRHRELSAIQRQTDCRKKKGARSFRRRLFARSVRRGRNNARGNGLMSARQK